MIAHPGHFSKILEILSQEQQVFIDTVIIIAQDFERFIIKVFETSLKWAESL